MTLNLLDHFRLPAEVLVNELCVCIGSTQEGRRVGIKPGFRSFLLATPAGSMPGRDKKTKKKRESSSGQEGTAVLSSFDVVALRSVPALSDVACNIARHGCARLLHH
jgi:hypothetical protein